MTISISVQTQGIAQAREVFDPRIVDQAVKSTLDKAARKVRTAITKEVRKDYAIKATAVKQSLTTHRLSPGASEVYIFSAGHRLSLKRFVVGRPNRRGVAVKIRKDRGRQRLQGAFIVPSLGGHVYRRTGEPKRLTRHGRYATSGIQREPIKKLWSLSIPQMVASRHVMDAIQAQADEAIPRLFRHELAFRVNRVINRR